VLIDGRPVRGCLTLAADCAGRAIETIEGQAEGVALSRVQAAFVAANAAQCGFCTPGMVLAVTALLRETPRPGAEDVRQALSGNLCRCSGYAAIVEAALMAAEGGAP
jgi:aerobic-type carbon monoxide dehydrogenase small subunit (CoxS/CutS family)